MNDCCGNCRFGCLINKRDLEIREQQVAEMVTENVNYVELIDEDGQKYRADEVDVTLHVIKSHNHGNLLRIVVSKKWVPGEPDAS